MRKLAETTVVVAVIVAFLCVGITGIVNAAGKNWEEIITHRYDFGKEKAIVVEKNDEYIEIKFKNKDIKDPHVIRVYPCGQVDKMVWETIVENVEQDNNLTLYWSSGLPTVIDTRLPDIIVPNSGRFSR